MSDWIAWPLKQLPTKLALAESEEATVDEAREAEPIETTALGIAEVTTADEL